MNVKELAVIEPEYDVPSLPSDPDQLLAYKKWQKAEADFASALIWS